MKTSWLAWLSILAALLVLACWIQNQGLRVRVTNKGPAQLHSVVVLVTGQSYALGDIASNSSKAVRVDPTSKSHVEIEFRDANGGPVKLNAGGYFNASWTGTYSIEVAGDNLLNVTDDMHLPGLVVETLGVTSVVIACGAGLALGFYLVWSSLGRWQGAKLAMTIGGVITVLGSLMSGFMIGAWGEQLLGAPVGLFLGCLVAALVLNGAMAGVGAFIARGNRRVARNTSLVPERER